MTQTAIQTQIEVIKKATSNALKSKESALKFLIGAGIVRPETKDKAASPTVIKKQK